MPERLETYNPLERLGIANALGPRFLEQIDHADPASQQRRVYEKVDDSLVNAMLAYDWKYTLADNDLPKVRGTADLAGLEVAFPLLAAELVDFSLRLPPSLKVRGLTLRYFFKRALRDFLPVEILRKRKHGFGLPFGPWLRRDAALRKLASESLEALAERGVTRPDFVRSLLDRHLDEALALYGGMIWVLLMLEQWLQAHAPGYRA
jgi:asparagine synthase (glutamine-hydrolysing)